MKWPAQEDILIALTGATLALCLAGSALMTLPEAVAGRSPVHRELQRAAGFTTDTAIEMACDITAYCPGSCCNSATVSENGITRSVDWSGRIAAGDFTMEELLAKGIGVAAVDPAVIPYGSIIEYGGSWYIALDTGSAIRGNRIDLLLPEHAETVSFGRRNGEMVRVLAARNPMEALAALRSILNND
ncbi:MAG: 3D domain-containing protein [Spirochaetes bacterium]|nr:3D domain-containing protein [Spirochaetota bacterium]